MPTLRLVPDLPGEPDDVALTVATDDVPLTVATDETLPAPGRNVPVQWFPCDSATVGAEVRTHVLTALNAWAVDTDTIADAMVLVSELVTNVRDHTASPAVGIRVRVGADRVVVAVIEQAAVDAPRDGRLPVGDDDASPLADRGRGLRILDSVASEWGFVRRAGVTTTWFALPATPPLLTGHPSEFRRF